MEKCKTLGNETFFRFSLNEQYELFISFGSDPQIIQVSYELINLIVHRVEDLRENAPNELKKVANYSLTNWSECPNTVLCPYIAKLVIDVFDIETIRYFNSTT